jgi:hypothetical protein
MSAIQVKKLTIQVATLGVLVTTSAGVANAQKAHAPGPPVTTHGEAKANASAAKGQANAEAKRSDAATDKTAKDADKKDDAAEHAAMKAAESEPGKLLNGIKLSKAEKTSVEAIEKNYAKQLKDLDRQEDAAEKSGTPDATITAKIDALRTHEAADLRAVLNPDQVKQFDKNAAAIGSKK